MGSITGALVVICINAASALLVELVLWLIAYRLPAFRNCKERAEQLSQKTDAMKAAPGGGAALKKNKEKKLERLEGPLRREVTQVMATVKAKQGFVTAGIMLALYKLLSSRYYGVALATLPFEPFPFVRKLSQYGLKDADAAACAYTFIFTLCQMGLRPTLVRLVSAGPTPAMLDLQIANPLAPESWKDK